MSVNRRALVGAGASLISGGCASVLAGATGDAAAPSSLQIGADIPWRTYLAQDMRTSGAILGPRYDPHSVEFESSRQRCVKLTSGRDYLEFAVEASANTMVVRYSLPDAPNGGGISSSLKLYRNGAFVRDIAVTSNYAWVGLPARIWSGQALRPLLGSRRRKVFPGKRRLL